MFHVEQFLMRLILLVFYFFKLECSSVTVFSTVTEVTKQDFICIFFCFCGNLVHELYSECFHIKK